MSGLVVVDLGCANTASVLMALERLEVSAQLSADPSAIGQAQRLILPGVGAAAFAMKRIAALGLGDILREYKRPLLGVCLGQQILFDHSNEGDVAGLGILTGKVTKINPLKAGIVPHMGWNQLTDIKPDPLTVGLSQGDYAYFVHSYACPIQDSTLASCDYGEPFAAIVRKANVWGVQFHPERSSVAGARLLRNFVSLNL